MCFVVLDLSVMYERLRLSGGVSECGPSCGVSAQRSPQNSTPLTRLCAWRLRQITACSEYLRYECAHAWQWSSNSLMVFSAVCVFLSDKYDQDPVKAARNRHACSNSLETWCFSLAVHVSIYSKWTTVFRIHWNANHKRLSTPSDLP